MDESLDRQFGSDIQVISAGDLAPSVQRELERTPGVGEVAPTWFAFVRFLKDGAKDEQGFARFIDPASYFRVSSFLFAEGTENAAKAGLAGEGVMITEGNASQRHLKVGDSVRLQTTKGPHDFKLVATYASFGGPPEVAIGIDAGRRYFNAGNPSGFQLNVTKGADVATVQHAIEQGVGSHNTVRVTTVATIKQEAQKQFGQFFNVFYAIIMVAGVVGLLGLANTLAMSVVQRTREIGILRAVGVTRPQMRRMVLVESATLSLVAFALSLPLGYVLSIVTLKGVGSAFGFAVTYVYPAAWVPIVGLFGVVVAVVAALAPGRRAARLHVVSALQYE